MPSAATPANFVDNLKPDNSKAPELKSKSSQIEKNRLHAEKALTKGSNLTYIEMAKMLKKEYLSDDPQSK